VSGEGWMPDGQATVLAPAGSPDGLDPRSARPESPETWRLYARDWTAFTTWCAATRQTPLPASAAAVAAFLTEAGPRHSAGTLARRVSAIAARHHQHGLVAPTRDQLVKTVLHAARRSATPRRKPPPAPAQLVRLAGACGGDLAGLRDRALLLLAASGLAATALVRLDAEHIRFTATAAELSVDPVGPGVGGLTLRCEADRGRCPVQALRDWLQASDTQFGPVFRKIDRWGNIEYRRFDIAAVRQIVRRRSRRRMRRAGTVAAP
jgi:site-specific recombinase XerC